MKTFNEFISDVKSNPELQEKLKNNPVQALSEYSTSDVAYTSDKLVYRIVVGGFVLVLVLGIVYFIYQYQSSLSRRIEYSTKIIETVKNLNTSDSLSLHKLETLKNSVIGANSINATTPDGIIAVFTAIIGALAGLFAPSPVSRKAE